MTLKQRFSSRRKLTASVAAGVAAITLGIGGYGVAHSRPGNGASVSRNTTAGTAVPFQAGQPGLSKSVGQVPAAFKAGSGTIVSGTAAEKAKAAALAASREGPSTGVSLRGAGTT